jgi:hypothetical protein
MPRWIRLSLPLLAAAAARASLLLSTSLMPGINGAYYLVQARSILQKGALAIPDLPLVFVVHAAMAAILDWLTPLSQMDAVIWAVKTGDALLPAFGVLPVMALAANWAKPDRINSSLAILAAVLVPTSALSLRMVGDFEKNSLGIAQLCSVAWALHEWMNHHGRKRALIAAGFLGLAGITHIGVFGSTLVLVAITLLAFAATQGRDGLLKVAKLAAIVLPIAVVAGAVVFWKFDPDRVRRLLGAISEPASFFRQGGPGPGRVSNPGGFQLNPGFILYGAAAISAALTAWFRRKSLTPGTVALIMGSAITVILLTGPWIQGDKTFRLQMNAAPLTWICLLFAVLQIGRVWVRAAVGGIVFSLLLAPSAILIREGGHPIITAEAQAELRQIAPKIAKPERTLISAHHGLEWWTAWTLGTHIAQAQALRPEDWQRYEMVCILEEKRGAQGGMPGPGFGPPGMGGGPREKGLLSALLRLMVAMPSPPGAGLRPGGGAPAAGPRPMPGNFGPPGDFPPSGGTRAFPAGRVIRPGEFPHGPPPPGFPPMGRGGAMMPGFGLSGAQIPDDAEILHDGAYFRLGKIATPPDFVREGQRMPRR